MNRFRAGLIWIALAAAIIIPFALAASSPLLAWRQPVYIVAGFAGVIAMGLLLLQPLLAGGYLPGISAFNSKRIHRWMGVLLVAAVIIHVFTLWLTSPPDVIDALTFTSPTPFSAWGVVAMWTVFAAALFAALRRRLQIRPRIWRLGHTGLALITIVGSVVHALLIEGTMEPVSKAVLCVLVVAATFKVLFDLRVWVIRKRAASRTTTS